MNFFINGHNIFMVVLIPFIASLILVPIFNVVARHINAMDYPNERKLQKVPMPRLGGLAIFFSFMLGYIFFAKESTIMLSILMGSFMLIIMGLVDSINEIKAKYQMIVQILAAGVVAIYGGLVLNDISVFGLNFTFQFPLNYIFTVLFIVSFINILNLIDGLDGLCGGISSIYFMTIAIIAFIMNQLGGLDVILALIMFGATLGFLVYNFPPARCYLGNAGSDFLGFIIGVIALLGFKATTLTSIIVPIVIMAIPIFDTLFAMIRRLIKGNSIFAPDKEHFHHQLLKLKFSPKTSILIIYFITIMFSSVSIFYALGNQKQAMFIYITLMVFLIFIVMKTDILFTHKETKIREEQEMKEKVKKEQEIIREHAKKNKKKKKNKK